MQLNEAEKKVVERCINELLAIKNTPEDKKDIGIDHHIADNMIYDFLTDMKFHKIAVLYMSIPKEYNEGEDE